MLNFDASSEWSSKVQCGLCAAVIEWGPIQADRGEEMGESGGGSGGV